MLCVQFLDTADIDSTFMKLKGRFDPTTTSILESLPVKITQLALTDLLPIRTKSNILGLLAYARCFVKVLKNDKLSYSYSFDTT